MSPRERRGVRELRMVPEMHDTKQNIVGELFRRHKRELFAYLARTAGRDNAPDLLQDTFARALGYGRARSRRRSAGVSCKRSRPISSVTLPAAARPRPPISNSAISRRTRRHARRRPRKISRIERSSTAFAPPPKRCRRAAARSSSWPPSRTFRSTRSRGAWTFPGTWWKSTCASRFNAAGRPSASSCGSASLFRMLARRIQWWC